MSKPLIVTTPPSGVARLRFVQTKGSWLSTLIDWREMGQVSHVEAVRPNGTIIAALINEGVVCKPLDYDKTSTSQIIVDVKMSEHSLYLWEKYLVSRIGRPYDFDAIMGIALHLNWRQRRGFICSMLQTLALRCACVFPVPLSEPAHEITPRDLLLVLSAHPAAIIHPKEEAK